jgi:NADP-dependent 3-hydroxy acid dehydrogenase YdfG
MLRSELIGCDARRQNSSSSPTSARSPQQAPDCPDQILAAEDIADAILYIVTRPRYVAIKEILVRPTEQVR